MSDAENQRTPDALTDLLKLRDKLFSSEVTAHLRTRNRDERVAFVDQRMKLSGEILRLEASQLSALRQAMEQHGAELDVGTRELTESLADLEASAQWAEGIGNVLAVVSRIVPVKI